MIADSVVSAPGHTWRVGRFGLGAAVGLAWLVGFLLATGRWGSYVGVASQGIFITDVVLAVIAATVACRPGGLRQVLDLRRVWPRGMWLLLVALVGWALLRLAADGLPSRDALRDFAPFLYLVVALLAAVSPPERVVRRMVVVVAVAHSSWLTYALAGQAAAARLPTLGRTRLFEIRTDFDATVCGVIAVLCVFLAARSASHLARASLVTLVVWQTLLVLSMNSRAGLLGSLVSSAAFGAAYLVRRLRGSRRARAAALGAAALLLVGLGLAATYSPPVQRLVGGFSDSTSAGAGTANARVEVYRRVTDYVVSSPGRLMIGVGFGPDFMASTGADALYEGSVFRDVRAPHNFVLNTWARLGIIAAVSQLVLVVIGFVLAVRVAMATRQPLVSILAAALALSLPLAAAVGVIFESPFGAVPYAWALGVLATNRPRRRALLSGKSP